MKWRVAPFFSAFFPFYSQFFQSKISFSWLLSGRRKMATTVPLLVVKDFQNMCKGTLDQRIKSWIISLGFYYPIPNNGYNNYVTWQNLTHFVQLLVFSGYVISDNKFKYKVVDQAFQLLSLQGNFLFLMSCYHHLKLLFFPPSFFNLLPKLSLDFNDYVKNLSH